MKIVIETELVPPQFHFNPHTPRRGTEKFYYYTAKCLAEAGHDVIVIYDGPFTTCVGARWMSRNGTIDVSNTDIAIVCNPRVVSLSGHDWAERVIAWTNFYMPNKYAEYDSFLRLFVDEVVVISQFAKQMYESEGTEKVRVVPHGIDRSIYFPPQADIERDKVVLYTSSPDRGLSTLQKVWRRRRILEETGYELIASPYGTEAMAEVTDYEIANYLRQSAFWIHPGQGAELFCLSGVEAQACGATPIIVPNGALHETVKYGYRLTETDFEDGLFAILSGSQVLKGVTADHIRSWESVTAELIGD